jgi:hypothetical protein
MFCVFVLEKFVGYEIGRTSGTTWSDRRVEWMRLNKGERSSQNDGGVGTGPSQPHIEWMC